MKKLLLLATVILGINFAQGQTAIAVQNSTNTLEPKIEVLIDELDLEQYTHVHVTAANGWYRGKQKRNLKKYFEDDNSLIKYSKRFLKNNNMLFLQSSVSVINNSNWTQILVFKNRQGKIIYKIKGTNQTMGALLEAFLL